MPSAVLALFVLLVLAGCAAPNGSAPDDATVTSDSPPPTDPPPPPGGPAASTRPAVALADLLAAEDGRALQQNLATPPRIEIEPTPNRHVPGQTDTLRTFFYDGLALEFYEVAGGPVFLQEVIVTGADYRTAEGLGVGSTRAEVEGVYTTTLDSEGDSVSYQRPERPDEPNPPVLRVRYEPAPAQAGGDRAAALTWRFYVD